MCPLVISFHFSTKWIFITSLTSKCSTFKNIKHYRLKDVNDQTFIPRSFVKTKTVILTYLMNRESMESPSATALKKKKSLVNILQNILFPHSDLCSFTTHRHLGLFSCHWYVKDTAVYSHLGTMLSRSFCKIEKLCMFPKATEILLWQA